MSENPGAPAPVPAGVNVPTGPIPPYFGLGSRAEPHGATAARPPAPEDGVPALSAGDGGPVPPGEPGPPVTGPAPGPAPEAAPEPEPAGPVAAWALTDPPGPPADPHPTAPVTGQPRVRARRRDPLTRMGPWAPVAGALLGLVAGLVTVAVLAGRADGFGAGLSLVFLVVGLTMLGAAGALLADEVRLVRRGAREAAVRPAWVEATAGLLNGLTPARLLLASSAFVLFLSAYVSR
ncbi:hypothetical protein [Blastococcus sp. SYSU D00820]